MIDRTGFAPIGWGEDKYVEIDNLGRSYEYEEISNTRAKCITRKGLNIHQFVFPTNLDASERYIKYRIFYSTRIHWVYEGYGSFVGSAKPDYRLNIDTTSYDPKVDGNLDIIYRGDFDDTGNQTIVNTGVFTSPFTSDLEDGAFIEVCAPDHSVQSSGVCMTHYWDSMRDKGGIIPYKAMNVANGYVDLDVKDKQSFLCCPTGNFTISSNKPITDINYGYTVDNFMNYSEMYRHLNLKIPKETEVRLIINPEDQEFKKKNYSQFCHYGKEIP